MVSEVLMAEWRDRNLDRGLLVETMEVVVFEDGAAKWTVTCVVGAE